MINKERIETGIVTAMRHLHEGGQDWPTKSEIVEVAAHLDTEPMELTIPQRIGSRAVLLFGKEPKTPDQLKYQTYLQQLPSVVQKLDKQGMIRQRQVEQPSQHQSVRSWMIGYHLSE